MPLHPQAQAFVETLAASDAPSWHEMSPTEGREVFASLVDLFAVGPDLAEVADRGGADDVPIRIYSSGGRDARPALIYFHGGGWVLGDLSTHDGLCRRLAAESGCVVVAVDYRRSPENRHPAAMTDCYSVTELVAKEAASFGVDPTRLAVGGDSAGGSLALGVSRMALERGGPAIQLQLLIYPVVEAEFETTSYLDYAEGYGLTRETMKWFWEQYLGDSGEHSDPFVAPSRAASLARLPKTHIVTAEYDVLRDEGEALARRLSEEGVEATLRRYDGMLHGFVHFSQLFDMGKEAVSDMSAVVRSALN